MPPDGHIFQINISNGGVPKLAVHEAVVNHAGIIADQQANRKYHGGPDKALCLYSLERILSLQGEGNRIFPGATGENVTLAGVDWEKIKPGARLHLGPEVIVEVTNYTAPCNKISPYLLAANIDRISQTNFPGWSRVYCRVLSTGTIKIADPATIVEIE